MIKWLYLINANLDAPEVGSWLQPLIVKTLKINTHDLDTVNSL